MLALNYFYPKIFIYMIKSVGKYLQKNFRGRIRILENMTPFYICDWCQDKRDFAVLGKIEGQQLLLIV